MCAWCGSKSQLRDKMRLLGSQAMLLREDIAEHVYTPAALVIFARVAIIVTVSQWLSKHRRRWSRPTKAVQSAAAALPNPLTCIAKEVTCMSRPFPRCCAVFDRRITLCVNILHFVTKTLGVWFLHLQIKHDVLALLHVPFERIEAAAEHWGGIILEEDIVEEVIVDSGG